MLLIAGTGGSASAAASSAASSSASKDIDFSVFGQISAKDGQAFDPSVLEGVGVTPEQVAQVRNGASPSARRGAAVPRSSGYDVTSSWQDQDGRDVYLRAQVYTKITTKHNVTTAVAQHVSQRPDKIVYPKTGTRYEYNARVNHVKCNNFVGCYVAESTNVLEPFDHRVLGQGTPGTYGVVTVYCPEIRTSTFCPDYVKQALNV